MKTRRETGGRSGWCAAQGVPPLDKASWRRGQYLKSLLWWFVLVPAGAVVFFSSAERVHVTQVAESAPRV